MDFQSLYKKYAPAVRRFALYLCGDRALADDITSETFLRVWSTRGRIRELTVKSYLFAVARNVHRDLQRQGWRKVELDDKHTDKGASVHKRLEHRQELETVLAELQKLQEIDRAALLMRAVEQVCAAGIMTPDLGGKATTKEVTRAVCEAVRGMNA